MKLFYGQVILSMHINHGSRIGYSKRLKGDNVKKKDISWANDILEVYLDMTLVQCSYAKNRFCYGYSIWKNRTSLIEDMLQYFSLPMILPC